MVFFLFFFQGELREENDSELVHVILASEGAA